MAQLLNPQSRSLFESHLQPSDRVLVTGAGGWFGRTATALLHGTGAELLAVASSARVASGPGPVTELRVWDPDEVARFDPTIIIDCAFLTRDRLDAVGLPDFVDTNRTLTERMLWAAGLPNVRAAITVSSGAAVYPHDALSDDLTVNPYGFLKREAENSLFELASSKPFFAVVARAWAVSGAFVRHPQTFALTDMIMQAAITGRIEIRATIEVWRRYVLVDELLAAAFAVAQTRTDVVESGGPLLEMTGLAEAVRDVLAPNALISRPELDGGEPNRYTNDGTAWLETCQEVGLLSADIRRQIEITYAGLGESGMGDPNRGA